MLVPLLRRVQVLPAAGWPFAADPVANLRYMALPVPTLAAQGPTSCELPEPRCSKLESPFIVFLRAKGIGENTILFRHALRNAAVPIVTVVGIQFERCLGRVVIETLFALPASGRSGHGDQSS